MSVTFRAKCQAVGRTVRVVRRRKYGGLRKERRAAAVRRQRARVLEQELDGDAALHGSSHTGADAAVDGVGQGLTLLLRAVGATDASLWHAAKTVAPFAPAMFKVKEVVTAEERALQDKYAALRKKKARGRALARVRGERAV